jgi:hypothetical protein
MAGGSAGGTTMDSPLASVGMGSLRFDGVNDFANVPNLTAATLGASDFTLEARVRITANTGARIVLGGRVTSSDGFLFGLLNGRVYVQFQGVPNIQAMTSPQLVGGVWTHIAVTRTNGMVSLLVNGTPYPVDFPNRPVAITGTGPIRIGADSTGSFFAGEIQLVRIWSVARSPVQLLANREVVVASTTPGLRAQWVLKDGSGQTLTDTQGMANAVLGMDATVEQSDPTWMP